MIYIVVIMQSLFKSRQIQNASLSFVRMMSKERAGKGIRPGVAIVLDGDPHRVTKIIQGKRGKGGGFVRATLKNLTSAQTYEKTFTSDETVEMADMEKETVQYSWNDGNEFVFMNTTNYEEVRIPSEDVDNKQFLLEGLEVKVNLFNGRVIGVEFPHICEYGVVSVDPTKAMGNNFPAVLDCGATVMVPAFVKEGTRIRVNVDEGVYVERAEGVYKS